MRTRARRWQIAAHLRSLAAVAGIVLLAGCATTGPASPADPFEPWNRAMYDVHQVVDGNFVKPVAQAYVDSREALGFPMLADQYREPVEGTA